jgi:general secretion pathway protein F
MRRFPRIFSDLYVNMISAGENSGALDVVLNRLADFTESQNRLRNKIRATLAYPVIMIFLSIGIVSFLMTYVVPKITKLFESTKLTLPLPTVILIKISNFLKQNWWLMLIGLLLLVIFSQWYGRTPRGRKRYDRIALKMPIFGKLILKIAVSRFAKTLSTLLSSGLPILKAMDIVKTVVGNVILSESIEKVKENISEGSSISGPLKNTKMFPPIVIHMIAVGEQTGELENMLARVSDAYDNEVDTSITALTSVLEPLILVVMGGVVLFIVLSILLPMLDLTSGIQ